MFVVGPDLDWVQFHFTFFFFFFGEKAFFHYPDLLRATQAFIVANNIFHFVTNTRNVYLMLRTHSEYKVESKPVFNGL